MLCGLGGGSALARRGLAALALGATYRADAQAGAPGYSFKGGYPNAGTVQKTYDEADLNDCEKVK